MTGEGALLHLYPDDGAAIAILTNGRAWNDGDWIGSIADEVAQALFPAPSDLTTEQRAAPAPPTGSGDKIPRDLQGRWSGKVYTWDEVLDVEVTFGPDRTGELTFQGELVPLTGLEYRDGKISASGADVRIPTPDAMQHEHVSILSLWPVGDGFRGQLLAFAGWNPVYFYALPSIVVLRRADTESGTSRGRAGAAGPSQ